MPASGPAKSGTLSATTGRPVSAKRAGSPLALMMRRAHCGVMRREHALEDGRAADGDAQLVAAAHAAREPAGEDEAEGRVLGPVTHHRTAALRRCFALSSST